MINEKNLSHAKDVAYVFGMITHPKSTTIMRIIESIPHPTVSKVSIRARMHRPACHRHMVMLFQHDILTRKMIDGREYEYKLNESKLKSYFDYSKGFDVTGCG